MNIYTGVVENRADPLKIGRCQVRIVGLHTENKFLLPTEQLPWAHPVSSINSASVNGIGWTPVGPVNGTWVVIMFTDEDQQQPLMFGTLPGIPQSRASRIAIEESGQNMIVTDGGLLTNSGGIPVLTPEGLPVQIGTTESRSSPESTSPTTSESASPKLTEQKAPLVPSSSTISTAINTTPPSGTKNSTLAQTNIEYLIAACDKVGLTSKYAKCAILGICGGESGWLCVEEGSYYSDPLALSRVFKSTFPNAEEAAPYTKWKGSKEDFFRKIYAPSNNGKGLGHKDPEDGAKYYGRGFNQITGRSLYEDLQKFLIKKGVNSDIVNKPNSLIDDPEVSALATAAFYFLKVNHDQNDPGYFQSALKRTGKDANGTGYAKKQKFYEHFLGQSVTDLPTNKPTADSQRIYTEEETVGMTPAKRAAALEDRSDNISLGFSDPLGKYPLRNLLDEPDTNRLSRGIQKETAIEFKDSSRSKQIPMANNTDNWDQPLAPFGGSYPYSKVFESESGHLLVYDDTPLNETTSFYHKSGSFIDVDANGTQVNKIMGDGYSIIERNGAIFIQGKCNLTIGNSVNVLVQGAADIQVDGSATINLKNHADIGIGGDLTLAVKGDIDIQSGGSINMQADGNINTRVKGNAISQVDGSVQITAGDSFNLETVGVVTIDAEKDFAVTSKETIGFFAEKDLYLESLTGEVTFGESSTIESEINDLDLLELTYPEYTTTKADQFPNFLRTPVRNSTPHKVSYELEQLHEKNIQDFAGDPLKYINIFGALAGVKPFIAPHADSGYTEKGEISGGNTSDIYLFLNKQLQLAQTGYWAETGMYETGSNPGIKLATDNTNITRIWTALGLSGKMWQDDQTPWCMGFVNWTLMQCGYRYTKCAAAREIATKTSSWGATPVLDYSSAEPGDIVLWNYNHVNFVYTNTTNGLTFVGGNQTSPLNRSSAKNAAALLTGAKNNPPGGDLTENYKGGWKSGGIVGIFRPSKV